MIDPAYRNERDQLLDLIIYALKADERVVAVWLAGSQGRSSGDDLSDLDLGMVVRDDCIAGIIAAPIRFVHGITPTVMDIEALANAPRGGAYLLTWIAGNCGPQQVDWYWQPASAASRPPDTELVFQRQSIPVANATPRLSEFERAEQVSHWLREALLMAFITAKHVCRGNPWTISRHFGHVAKCIATVEWLLDHGHPPAFDEPIDLRLPETTPVDSFEQLGWIRASVRLLIDRVSREQPAVLADHEAAIDQLNRWLDHVAGYER